MPRRMSTQSPRSSGCVGLFVLAGVALVAIVTGLWRAFHWGARSIAQIDAHAEARRRPETVQSGIPTASWAKGYAAMIAVVVVAVVASLLFLNNANAPATTALVTATDTPFIAPSDTSQPTAPPTVSTASLGGTESAFNAAFGTQIDKWTWSATVAGQPVKIFVDMLTASETTDGQNHTYIVDITVPDDAIGSETWTPQQANAIATAFLPEDATHVSDGVGAQSGEVDHIFHSSALAATFHADVFTNDAGDKTEPPGTLHFECNAYPPHSPNLGECYVSVGTQN